MINAVQIRSARAYLNWSTSQLAERAGMTVNAINRIERGHVLAQRGTGEKLEKIFESAGIEFLPSNGLRKRDNKIVAFEGKNAKDDLINDINTSSTKDGLLIVHGNNNLGASGTGIELLQKFHKKQKATKVSSRSLLGCDHTQGLPSDGFYHSVPEIYLSSSSLYVYASKLALSTDSHSPKAVIIDSPQIAESIKQMFNYIWDNTIELNAPTSGKIPKPDKKTKSVKL